MNNLSAENSITAGIVVFNTPLETLNATLTSLRHSTVSIRVVVLCNSPVSGYQDEVKLLCDELGVVCISNAPNRGFGAGHNQIWKSSNSHWYVCCNPDVIAEPTAIETLIRFGANNPSACLLMPKVLNIDGTIQPLARQHPTPLSWLKRQFWRIAPSKFTPFEIRFDYSKTQPVEFVTGCFFVSRVDLLEKINGFDESFFLYAEDADLSRRAEELGRNFYITDAVVVHVWAAAWKHNSKAFYRNLEGLFRYWIKHSCAKNISEYSHCIKIDRRI